MRAASSIMIVVLAGCPFGSDGPGGGDPCEDDANACGGGSGLEIDPSCTLDDTLQLELGDGEGEFHSLAPGAAPELVRGLQGRVHMVLGVGVDNPAPEYLEYEVQVTLSAEVDGETQTVGERTVVYDGDLVELEGGRVELLGLVVIPDFWPEDGRRWISAAVTDSCGRMGVVDQAIDE